MKQLFKWRYVRIIILILIAIFIFTCKGRNSHSNEFIISKVTEELKVKKFLYDEFFAEIQKKRLDTTNFYIVYHSRSNSIHITINNDSTLYYNSDNSNFRGYVLECWPKFYKDTLYQFRKFYWTKNDAKIYLIKTINEKHNLINKYSEYKTLDSLTIKNRFSEWIYPIDNEWFIIAGEAPPEENIYIQLTTKLFITLLAFALFFLIEYRFY